LPYGYYGLAIKVLKNSATPHINYTYNTDNQVADIVDSLGRQVNITYNHNLVSDPNDPDLISDSDATYDRIKTQLNGTGGWQIIKIYRTKLGKALRGDLNLMSLPQMFFEAELEPSSELYNPNGVIKKVKLPDGRSYKLSYNPYNEIARVELPTGGAFEYEFPMPEDGGTQPEGGTVFRPVKERRVYASGGSIVNNSNFDSQQKYPRARVVGENPSENASKITVEGYSGSINGETSQIFSSSDHYFYGWANSLTRKFYGNWKEGHEYKTEVFDADGQLRQKTDTEWAKPVNVAWGDTQVAKKVQINSNTTTVFEGSNSLTSKVEYGYDNDSLTNNKTDEYIFDYSTGTPTKKLKHNKTYYLKVNPVNGQDYTSDAIYLHGLPEKSELYEVNADDTEILVSKSEIKYDEGGDYEFLPGGGTPSGWTNPGNTPRGNATTSIAYNLSGGGAIATHARFDEFGNVRMAWDANNVMSEVQYSADYGYALPTKTISAKPDPGWNFGSNQEFETTTVYDFYTGLVKSVTDANGQTAQTSYKDPVTQIDDPLLRPRKVTAPNGQQTIFEYGDDPSDLYVKAKTQIDGTNWAEATEYFDGLGRKYKTQTKDSAGDVFTETEYDNAGRVKRVTNPYRAIEPKLWSETRYDALGRLVETFAPAASGRGNSLGITSYDLATDANNPLGAVVIGTDAAGRKSRSITNALGQLIRVDEPTATGGTIDIDLGPLTVPTQATTYKYDALGKMIEVTQGGQKRFFLYDTLGRLLRVRQPEQEINAALDMTGHPTNTQWTAGFTYDANGNVLTAMDAKNVTITNTYDNLNRVKTRTYAGEPSGQQTPTVYFTYDGVYYRYDGYKLQAAGSAKGALTQVRNGISTSQTITYDSLGRPEIYQQITDGQTYSSSYQYNLSGALVQEMYPSGRTVKNEFDANGDLSRIAGKANINALERTYANSFAYTASGAIAKLKLGNGLWEAAKFNTRLQITELGLGIGADNLDKWKVNYDYGELDADGTTVNQAKNTGNIAKQSISFQGLTNPFIQTYKYDSLYRLTEAKETSGSNTNWTQTFTYDRFGNRLTFAQNIGGITNNQTPTVDAATNRFSDIQSYGYDLNGNLIVDSQGRQFTFNGENKQTQVKDASNNVIGQYFYDGEGKRVKKEPHLR